MTVQESGHVERNLERTVQFRNLARVACAHQPDQAMARNRENVVEVRHTLHGQPLAAPQDDLSRKMADRSSDEYDHYTTDAVDNGIAGQEHDRPVTDWWGQLSPPDFPTFHARLAFHAAILGSSGINAACVSATSPASTSVMLVASRYWRTASSTSTATSRPCVAARPRSCSSTAVGRSMLMVQVYPCLCLASTLLYLSIQRTRDEREADKGAQREWGQTGMTRPNHRLQADRGPRAVPTESEKSRWGRGG